MVTPERKLQKEGYYAAAGLALRQAVLKAAARK